MREALDRILSGHEPYPAVVVDRAWNLVAANSAMRRLAEEVEIDPALLEPPVNMMRLGLHPRGLAPLIVNLGQWRAHLLERLERQLAVDRRPATSPPCSTRSPATRSPSDERGSDGRSRGGEMLGPVRLRAPGGGELSFFGMFATFDTPFEVTTSELAMELLFPADRATAEALADACSNQGGA